MGVRGRCKTLRALEAGDGERVDAGLGAPSDHDVRVTEGDEACRVAYGVCTSGAGCGGGVGWAFETEFHRNMAGGQVDEEAGDEIGGDFLGTL